MKKGWSFHSRRAAFSKLTNPILDLQVWHAFKLSLIVGYYRKGGCLGAGRDPQIVVPGSAFLWRHLPAAISTRH